LADIPTNVAETLRQARESGHINPIVVGAIPFKNTEQTRLFIPQRLFITDPLSVDSISFSKADIVNDIEFRRFPEPKEFVDSVAKALSKINAGELSKVVLSRTLELRVSSVISIQQLLLNLALYNPNGYTFSVNIPALFSENHKPSDITQESSPRTLLGASPELLVSRLGRRVVANPLAGSIARGKDPVEDKQQACTLLNSAKDRHEHALVVDTASKKLQPFCKTLYVPFEPSLLHTSSMWHLSTEIVGELANPTTSSLTLATALHPTPAVCGFPTYRALEMIQEIEHFDRGFYTGLVGWCNATGDGEWVVTIRCAEMDNSLLRLFAGAGIVAGSVPERELVETSAKFRTILNAMGIEQSSEVY
jgi:isochorismate synthase